MKQFGFAGITLVVALVFAVPSFAGSTKDKVEHCKGTITVIDGAKGSLKIRTSDGKEKTFSVPDQTKIATANKDDATLADLNIGDIVKVTYTDLGSDKLAATKIRFLSADKPKAPAQSPAAK